MESTVEPLCSPDTGDRATRADFEHVVTGYDAAIAYVDHHVGLLLEELRRQDLYDDCAVIVAADHGEGLGERGVYTDRVSSDECIPTTSR